VALALALVLLIGHGCGYEIIQGRIKNGVYASPDGGFRVQVPPLVRPGVKVEDGTPAADAFFVSFSDELCRAYMVTERTTQLADQSLESWIEQDIVPKLQEANAWVLERKAVDTKWGPAVFFRYREPRGGPCVTRAVTTGREERPTVEDVPDAQVGMYLLRSGRYVYRIVYGAGENMAYGDTFEQQRFPIEEKLNRFFEGFEPLRGIMK
jgi:hypothetical protein